MKILSSGSYKQFTDWHRISVFRKNLRERVASSVKKGCVTVYHLKKCIFLFSVTVYGISKKVMHWYHLQYFFRNCVKYIFVNDMTNIFRDKLYVKGAIRYSTFLNKDGQNVNSTSIVAGMLCWYAETLFLSELCKIYFCEHVIC